MSKLQFFQMRSEEISQLYPADFSKKEATKTGINLVNELLESGNVDKDSFTVNLARLNEVISSALSEIKKNISEEKRTVLGAEINYMNGRTMYNFSEDELYSELSRKLKAREELLKVALKSDEPIYDSEGVEVPKISTSNAKGSITIKF